MLSWQESVATEQGGGREAGVVAGAGLEGSPPEVGETTQGTSPGFEMPKLNPSDVLPAARSCDLNFPKHHQQLGMNWAYVEADKIMTVGD